MNGKDYQNEEFGCKIPESFVSMNYISNNCNEESKTNFTKVIDEKISDLFKDDNSYSFTRDGETNDVYEFYDNKVGKKYGQLVDLKDSGILEEDASIRTVPVIVALLAVILLLI